jgi:hypothetical protein
MGWMWWGIFVIAALRCRKIMSSRPALAMYRDPARSLNKQINE